MTAITPLDTPSLDDVFLLAYCLIDDLYVELAPPSLRQRPRYERLEMSDAEVLTLSVMQEALSIDSESSFMRFVRRNLAHLFPRLLTRDRYSRRRRALTPMALRLFRRLADGFEQHARWLVIDSAPIETASFVRSQSAGVSMPEAAYGYIPSKKRHFFGFRLHLVVTDEGAISDFGLCPADVDERTVAREVLRRFEGYDVLADHGYSGDQMQASAARAGYRLAVSPKRSQKPTTREEALWRRWLRSKRDLVESVFGMLADQFRLETTRALSTRGLQTRIVAKVLSFNLSLTINRLLGRDLLAVKSLYL
jgi:transposase